MSNPQVELHILDHGVITIELDAEKAPKCTENFLSYVNKGHYDKTIFHRVIPGFMIQGGGFEPGMTQKECDEPIENEANNGLKNNHYTLAMARTSDPHSATAQFFINTVDNAFLDPTPIPEGDPVKRFEYRGQVYENVPRENLLNALQLFGYTVFGKVTAGMDVVNKIRTTPTGMGGPFRTDVPKTPVTILSITLVQ